ISARNSAVVESQPKPPPMPSLEAIAKLIGVNLESEPELTHIVSEMQTTPLPPTWTIEEIGAGQTTPRSSRFTTTGSTTSYTADSEANLPASAIAPRLEYVNRLTRERTCTHPGTPYFLRAVERERVSNQRQRRGEVVVVSGTLPNANNSSHNSIIDTMDWSFPSTTAHPEEDGHAGRGSAPSVSTIHDDTATMDDDQPVVSTTDSGTNNSSKVRVVRREKPEAGSGTVASSSFAEEEQGNGAERGSTHQKRAPSSGGKGGERRAPPPKWLVFTSWWHETTTGTENTINRKHASIRYSTANGSLEVELEDVPAIFEVSHARGRYGKVGTVDIRVGAQLSILGRQMRLMQARACSRLQRR
ncbi:unnamed protein product, partial [Ectocarpus sp. 12 AP-2014]